MNRIVINYSHDHEDDTKLVYSFDEKQSHLDMSYTSEDPDYGTDHLEYNSEPVASLHDMATEYLEELTRYLDNTSDGLRRPGNASAEDEMVFGEYGNSTLYAIENALRTIVGEQDSVISMDGNLMEIMTVREAAKLIKDTFAERRDVHFDLGCSMDGIDRKKLQKYASYIGDVAWFGCKMIPNDGNLFDGSGFETDYLFVVGHYGGGNIQTAYYAGGEYASLKEQDEDELVEALCNSMDVTPDEKIILETVELKGKDL